MSARLWIIILSFISSCALADSPQQMASIGDLLLDSGETLQDCKIGYRTAGTLNADKSNVLLVPTWFTGASGDLMKYEVIGQYPEFMDKAVPIDGSPKMTSYDLVQWQTHETAIEMMQEAGISNAKITEFLASANLVTLWTPDYFVENITPEAFPEYLASAVKDYEQLDASDYLSQLRAMMAHDVYADHAADEQSYIQKVKASVLVIGVVQDHMVNPTPGKVLSESIGAQYAGIESNCGHMGSSCEDAEVGALVNAFLQQ